MKSQFCFSSIIIILFFELAYTEKLSPTLIFNGVDTLITYHYYGFDFITQTACTLSTDYSGCYQHFYFNPFSNPNLHYDLRAWQGYGVKMGKTNLDSMKSAPPDSIFLLSERGKIDSIPPDSLASRVGNCYWIKTGTDPRPAWSGTYYAKIKILNFKVLDASQRKVEMVFLWAFQAMGTRDINTSGLDTFHLDVTPVISHSGQKQQAFAAGGQRVFKVVGDRFYVPRELAGTNAQLSVYDLRGKRLGRIALAKNMRVIDIAGIKGKTRGMVVVRIEKTN